jgi:hypothetical protein
MTPIPVKIKPAPARKQNMAIKNLKISEFFTDMALDKN